MALRLLFSTLMILSANFAAADNSRDGFNKSVTMHDLNKTLETCRSLENFNGYCADAAKVCAAEESFEAKRACLEKQSK